MSGIRRVLWIVAAIAAASPLGAQVVFDAGGAIRNTTGAESLDGLVQRDRVSAWLELRSPRTLFELAGAYSLSLGGGTSTHVIDVEKLALTSTVTGDGAPLSRFDFALGRTTVTDHTGLVMSQVLDGLSVSVAYPVASIQASVGTTFLQLNGWMYDLQSSLYAGGARSTILSQADALDVAGTDPANRVVLGSPRVLGLVEVVFPNIFRQRLTLSFAMQEDLRGLLLGEGMAALFPNRAGILSEGTTTQDPALGGLVDTQYMGLGVRGSIVGWLSYNVFGSLGTGRTLSYVPTEAAPLGAYTYTPILGVLGGLGLNLGLPKVLDSRAGIRFVLSTGDTWDERTTLLESSTTLTPNLFLPITAVPLSPVLRASLGNIAFVELSYGLRPFSGTGVDLLSRLDVGLTGLLFLRPSAGPVSVSTPNTAADASPYLGMEWDLRVGWRPFSDVQADVTAGLFLPNTAVTGAFAGEAARWRLEAAVSLTL